MSNQIKLERIREVPADARVCHYDELEETVKHRFAEVVESGSTDSPGGSLVTEVDVCGCDIVKFTEYYHLSCL